MWSKFKEQLLAIIFTVLVIAGAAYWLHTETLKKMAVSQERELARVREQTQAEIKSSGEENLRQIAALNLLLTEAIQKRASDAFLSEEEVAQLNTQRVNQLAEAIAAKIQPYPVFPKTLEEAERTQNEQVDKVSGRLSDRIQPILAQMTREQNLTRESLDAYSAAISEQVSGVLSTELAKNQQLNNNLLNTQAIARESLALSQELTALYLSTFKDQGLVTRLLTLPANVVRDVSKMSIVNSTERKKIEEQLVQRMNELQKQLDAAQAQTPSP